MRWRLVWVVGVLSWAASCGGGSNVPRCTPGASVACTGAGACSGHQICNADGTFAACICAHLDGGPDAGSDAADAQAGTDADAVTAPDATDTVTAQDATDAPSLSEAGSDGLLVCPISDAQANGLFESERSQLVTATCDRAQRCNQIGADASFGYGSSYEDCLIQARKRLEDAWSPLELCRQCPQLKIDPERLDSFCLADFTTIPCMGSTAVNPFTAAYALDCSLRSLCGSAPPM